MLLKKIKYNLIAKALYSHESGFKKQSIVHKTKVKYSRKTKHKSDGRFER